MRVMRERLGAFVYGPDRKMSARELSRRAGLSDSAIYQMTSGRQRTCLEPTARRIAEVLGVPVDVVFDPVVPSTARRSDKREKVSV